MRHDIKFSCVGDGKNLAFMSVVDAYSILGNALDNAIEAVNKLKDKNHKQISLVLEKKGEFINICIMNYTENKVSGSQEFPESTKENDGYHGFGLKSIAYIAKKYGGNIEILQSDGIFKLNIYLLARNNNGE